MFAMHARNFGVFMGAWLCLSGVTHAQYDYGPFALHRNFRANALPVAIYKGAKVEDFRKILIASFEKFNFLFVATSELKNNIVLYRFSYPVSSEKGAERLMLSVRVDQYLDSKRHCVNCFLRGPELTDEAAIEKMPWMDQYELSSKFFPDIDNAYSEMRLMGSRYMDVKYEYSYQNVWSGERNIYGNSFVGIGLQDFKALIVQSYERAGFVYSKDSGSIASKGNLLLDFYFPIDPGKKEGVIYGVRFRYQLDVNGSCNPCEVSEAYDPYQQLPASGLLGMASRLTLESRFAAGRTLAIEQMKSATADYLRPRSIFSVPPKPAPIGSPRPQIPPPVVT